jgi:hypothetical protein
MQTIDNVVFLFSLPFYDSFISSIQRFSLSLVYYGELGIVGGS